MLIMLLSARHFFTVCRYKGNEHSSLLNYPNQANPYHYYSSVGKKHFAGIQTQNQQYCPKLCLELEHWAGFFRNGTLQFPKFFMQFCVLHFYCQAIGVLYMGKGPQDSTALKRPTDAMNPQTLHMQWLCTTSF